MPVTTENLKRWIEQSSIDYVTYFIKAWIPFNSWYNSHFSSLEGERSKINATKNDSNPVRNGISTFLENEGQEGENFRSYLSALHHSIENYHISNRDGRITFHEIIKEKNPLNIIDNEEVRRIKYYLKREDGRRLGEVSLFQIFLKDNRGVTFFNYQYNAYDIEHIQNSSNFSNLSHAQKENLRLYFNKLTPVIVIDALENNLRESPKNYYNCDSYNFKRDLTDSYCRGNFVSKSLVEIMYQLRNILFHGELIPTEGIQPIYKNAYFLLKMILDKLR